MRKNQVVEIVGGVEVADDIQQRIKKTGVRNLDFEKAKELGVFQRMSYLLCASHATILAAYRIYGGMDYMMSCLNADKNEIRREMNRFEKAFDRFLAFWTDYYSKGVTKQEVLNAMETLYYNIMEWMQLPDNWDLGEEQRLELPTENAITFTLTDNLQVYTFRPASVNSQVEESSESWAVLKFDFKTSKQVVVEDKMDKASALMSAKRMSANDVENIYTAAQVIDLVERRTDITPFKSFRANETIGKITKTLKERAVKK